VSWASDPHIRVISEGSCDTEDWSNDAENHRNKWHFTVYSHRDQMIYIRIIFQYFYCIVDQINTALVSRRDSYVTCNHLKQSIFSTLKHQSKHKLSKHTVLKRHIAEAELNAFIRIYIVFMKASGWLRSRPPRQIMAEDKWTVSTANKMNSLWFYSLNVRKRDTGTNWI